MKNIGAHLKFLMQGMWLIRLPTWFEEAFKLVNLPVDFYDKCQIPPVDEDHGISSKVPVTLYLLKYMFLLSTDQNRNIVFLSNSA